MYYDYGDGVYAVDAEYKFRDFTAVFVVKTDDGAIIIETAHGGSLPRVLEALPAIGVGRDEVRLICLTHVHLDHAGGAGAYMRAFPGARLVVHSRGARHMIAPERLWAGTVAVYGEALARELYGELVPVPADRVVVPEDGERIAVGGRSLVCVETPGHALHHISYHLEDARAVFAGDTFGMNIAHELESPDGRRGLLPSLSPSQCDPDAMNESIDRIVALAPRRVYPTHFTYIDDVEGAAEELRRMVSWHARATIEAAGDERALLGAMLHCYDEERERASWRVESSEAREWIDALAVMNTKGLVDWYSKRR